MVTSEQQGFSQRETYQTTEFEIGRRIRRIQSYTAVLPVFCSFSVFVHNINWNQRCGCVSKMNERKMYEFIQKCCDVLYVKYDDLSLHLLSFL